MRTALLVGASGLVGGELLDLLLSDSVYGKVVVLTRKPLSIDNAKYQNHVVDFDRLTEYYNDIVAQDIFCCLGTTMRVAGSKDAFKKVDYTYPLEIARLAKAAGAEQYLLVSALGANEKSSIFYNKVKGEIEHAIETLNYQSFKVFRPSLLLGSRSEQRNGEDAAKIFYKVFGFIIPAKYKAIEARSVAMAMLTAAKLNKPGMIVYESDAMRKME
ncbi:oxidoreductase [Chryseotalea sanaruensis]|uniref:Oxidoreductase n=1 Tax=Chryseotalea sanaruensis TaxID=2482724 RepID=A0A401UFL7_9BACT|nr:oxidoreductase [Chryseotalea sanaruensis]GCC53662.1 oxidoreductase [Chryseotalea sanaruensis]